MKKSFILALAILFILVSCGKSSVAPPTNSLNSTSASDAVARKSNFDLITAHPWMFNKYYTNYVDSANKGQLIYRRGRARNQINLDNNRLTLNVDGTSVEVDQYGGVTYGTWHFTDSTETKLVIFNFTGEIDEDILYLNKNNLHWVREGYNVYAEYITAQ